jgi:hypothetical protein
VSLRAGIRPLVKAQAVGMTWVEFKGSQHRLFTQIDLPYAIPA